MKFPEQWIWLPEDRYPDYQRCKYSFFSKKEENTDGFFRADANEGYCVAEFRREYKFDKKISLVKLRTSGDTYFDLSVNGCMTVTGPVTVEGDFINNDMPRNNYYATEITLSPDTGILDFYARVRLSPVIICEYSKGHGGFMLTAHVTFCDGTKTIIATDSSWKVRYNGAYKAPSVYDGRIEPDEYINAEIVSNIWNAKTAPIKVRDEKEVLPLGVYTLSVKAHESVKAVMEFDKIYAGYIHIQANTEGELHATVHASEVFEEGSCEEIVFTKDDAYRSIKLHSAGRYVVEIENKSDSDAKITAKMITTYYPIKSEAKTITSDKELNLVLDVCAHTLKYARQLHHLDSPRHCEPLACTGDYYVETLMTAFSFGDMSLSEFDVLRTAELLRGNDGCMFHTTYSLIWVRMLWDVYMFTGNKSLLEECEDALIMLLNRFMGYVSDTGLVENPPNFMFVDWIYIDGLSMHHPPKALGQTCLNMFYYDALKAAECVFCELFENAMAAEMKNRREKLKVAINKHLFDAEKGLYFEGLNTKTPEELLHQYMPQNTDKRYYLKHSNILAAYVGVCDEERSRDIIEKIMTDECPGEYQPYFAHFLLEAVYKNGLREKYTLKILEKWKKPVQECGKGLVEGFIPPEPTYIFDHSHPWGGTPLYSLPKAILGVEILKPGMTEIEISPSLIGLESAQVEIPVRGGCVKVKIEEGKEYLVTHPDDVNVRIK